MRRIAQIVTLSALAAAGILAAAVLAPGGGASPAAAAATPTKVSVTASEFKFKLIGRWFPPAPSSSRSSTAARSAMTSESRKKTPTIAPGASAKLTVNLTKSGKVGFLCTLAGHAAAGMKGTLPVTMCM